MTSQPQKLPRLKVKICSFSYKDQVPFSGSPDGGGFVFDCRCLPNPGREVKFSHLTGCDQEVVEYLEALPEVHRFADNILNVVTQSIEAYIKRGFTNLMVCFGCTGGQHRSVYLAERLAKSLRALDNVDCELSHSRIGNRGLQNQTT